MGKSANTNANALGDAGDHVFTGVIDRDAVEHEPGAESKMAQLRRARGRHALANPKRDAVAVQPAVADLGADAPDEPSMMQDRHRLSLLHRELCGERDVEWTPRAAGGEAERRAEWCHELVGVH